MSSAPPAGPSALRRIAALAAILLLALAIVLIVMGAAGYWRTVLFTILGLMVIVIGGWYAVSRRGMARTIAWICMLGGVALLIVGFFLIDLGELRLIEIVVVAGISVVLARYALGKAPADPRPVGSSVEPAKHPVLIMNPKSGGGKAEKFHLVDECEKRGIEPIVLKLGDDLVQLAEDAIARGADVIGMAGGDGSQALVATVASRHDVPHVVIPAGTRNHLALDLGLDRDDVVGALDAFSDGIERRVDLGKVNGRVFVNNASLGLYAKIVQSPEYRDAKRDTVAKMLPELLGPHAEPLDLRFVGPDGTEHPTAHMILVSNDPYQLDQLGGFGTRERMDDGTLGVVAVRIAGAGDATKFMALEQARQVQRFSGWLEWSTQTFRIDSGGPIEIGIDGEALTMDPPLVFESIPGALRVRVPRQSIGRSPAARALHLASMSTVAQLGRVVAGKNPRA
jgi:diacylglycerol kinase family enzyme